MTTDILLFNVCKIQKIILLEIKKKVQQHKKVYYFILMLKYISILCPD